MTALVEISNLRKTYGHTVAVDDVSFQVEEGEIFGVLGPNGAGKTTTVECVGGLRRADAGSIRVLGLDPAERRGPDAAGRRQEMSPGMRTVSDYSPLGAAVQAFQDAINGAFPPIRFLAVLAGYAAVFGYAAVRQFAWE